MYIDMKILSLSIIIILLTFSISQPIFAISNSISPLQQFKSGILAKDVKCKQDLLLMIKTENNFPACVTPDTAQKLVERGWGMIIKPVTQQTPEVTPIPNSFEGCNTSYPQIFTGIAVLYMPLNSTGKICVQYSNSNPPTTVGMGIFEANHIFEKPKNITFWPVNQTISTGNSTIVYTIRSENQLGFYGVDFFCAPIPLAVGYDNNSRIISGDFPWLLGKSYNCPAETYTFHITGTTGIGVKFIPYP